MDLTYRLSVRSRRVRPPPAARLDVGIEASRQGRPVLEADLALTRIELTPAHALASLARHPLATVGRVGRHPPPGRRPVGQAGAVPPPPGPDARAGHDAPR